MTIIELQNVIQALEAKGSKANLSAALSAACLPRQM
jgi:hypothetical protein